MGRQRGFSEEQVLDSVAAVFTERGYAGTSVADLAQATQLGKQSLYNSFGDKRELYLKAVDCAVDQYGPLMAAMRNAPTGLAALEMFFVHLVEQCNASDASTNGCIVSNGLLENLPDRLVHSHLVGKWQQTHEALRDQVERGQKDGSVTNRAPSVALADVLMGLMSGIRVALRAGHGIERLNLTVMLGLGVLRQ
jgi:TetR/AcrR family transcriptional regulator, transcriptional repressor for nem operon